MREKETSVPPREGLWFAKPQRTRIAYSTLHAAFGMVWVVLVFGYVFSHPDLKHMPLWLAQVQLAMIVIPAIYCLFRECRLRRLTREDVALLERPEGLDEYPVEISVKCGPKDLGNDRGVVYFDAGLLGFVGGRTSFLISTDDLIIPTGKVLSGFDSVYHPLTLKATGGKASVTIRPLLGFGRAYRRSLRSFLRERKVTLAPRQLPPLTAYSEARVDVPVPQHRS